MLPYWLLYVLTAVPALIARGGLQDRKSRWGATLLAIFIVLLIGLRFEVGQDWRAYTEMFVSAGYLDFSDIFTVRGDPAFSGLNWLTAQAGLDYWVVNLVCAIIFTYGLFRFSFHLPNPWLAVAIAAPYLIVVVAMGYTRQGVAIGLVMVALTAVVEQSFARFVFWILFATAFHKSAIILIPLIGLSYTQNRLVVSIAAVVFSILGYYLFVASAMDLLVTNYIEYEYESQGAALRVVMNAVPGAIFLLTMRKYPLSPSVRKMWRNFAIAALVSVPVVFQYRNTTAIDRLALYLIPLQLFVFSWLPSILAERGQPDRKVVIAILIYSAAVLYVWLNYATHSEGWIPYRIYPILG